MDNHTSEYCQSESNRMCDYRADLGLRIYTSGWGSRYMLYPDLEQFQGAINKQTLQNSRNCLNLLEYRAFLITKSTEEIRSIMCFATWCYSSHTVGFVPPNRPSSTSCRKSSGRQMLVQTCEFTLPSLITDIKLTLN